MIKNLIKEVIGLFLTTINDICYPREQFISIYFHNPSKKVFENVLKWLTKNGYDFVSTAELKNFIADGVEPTGRKASITFDDGWNDNLKLIDLIEKYQVPVTIFIPTKSVEEGNYWFEYAGLEGQEQYSRIKRKEDFKKLPGAVFEEKVKILKSNYSLARKCLTLPELQKLSQNKLITIGSHSVTHPILINLTPENQERELIDSKNILSTWLKKEIDFLAYPNGDYNELTIDIAKKCGYKLGFSTKTETWNVTGVNPFIIPRRAINDDGGYYENTSKILGIWQRLYSKTS